MRVRTFDVSGLPPCGEQPSMWMGRPTRASTVGGECLSEDMPEPTSFLAVEDLDAAETLAAAESGVRDRRAVEVRELELALHWADLHAHDPRGDGGSVEERSDPERSDPERSEPPARTGEMSMDAVAPADNRKAR